MADHGYCTDDCGRAMWGDSDDRTCKPCISECEECSDGTSCIQCIPDWFVSSSMGNVLCVETCESDEYPDDITGLCTACDPACLTCTGDGFEDCSECSDGYF